MSTVAGTQETGFGVQRRPDDPGWVLVGDDHDTPVFAVNAVRDWWATMGRARYPAATRLLVAADTGGSNSYRSRVWKVELARLADETGLEITVCHYPTGTSKWNKLGWPRAVRLAAFHPRSSIASSAS